jgi:hypothetical protein
MKSVLRGYAKDKDGNLILIGTMPVPHSKDKASPGTSEQNCSLRLRSETRILNSPQRLYPLSATFSAYEVIWTVVRAHVVTMMRQAADTLRSLY